MGIVSEYTKQRVAELSRKKSRGFKDVQSLIAARKQQQAERLGKLGARFLDSIMPRTTLEGWGYSVDKKTFRVIWQHTRWNEPVTQDQKQKKNALTGDLVRVQDVIHFLDVGTDGHEPLKSDFMEFVGKYEKEGTGNTITKKGKLVWRTRFVRGITAHNFFKRLSAYLRHRGDYKVDFQSPVNAELESLISGRRRRGYTK